MRQFLVLAVLLVVLAGCGAGAGSVGVPAESTGLDLPSRPREVRIDGVDPCSLLTEEQWLSLGLDGDPSASQFYSQLYSRNVDACLTRGYVPSATYGAVSLVAGTGIERYVEQSVSANLSVVDVNGYPALQVIIPGDQSYCTVIVDNAPGQVIDVQFADGGRVPPVGQDELCRSAGLMASEVMDTLLMYH